jgi:hypothetical protein
MNLGVACAAALLAAVPARADSEKIAGIPVETKIRSATAALEMWAHNADPPNKAQRACLKAQLDAVRKAMTLPGAAADLGKLHPSKFVIDLFDATEIADQNLRRDRGEAKILARDLHELANMPASSSLSCADRTSRARDEVLAVTALDENIACARDADCITVGIGNQCFDACWRSLNTRGVQAESRAAIRIGRTLCATFEADGCQYQEPSCPDEAPESRCNEGKCAFKKSAQLH